MNEVENEELKNQKEANVNKELDNSAIKVIRGNMTVHEIKRNSH